MLYILHPINALLMMGLPIVLGVLLTRRWRMGWGLWGIGAATFVLSQVVHLPLNWALTRLFVLGLLPAPPAEGQLIFNAAVLGLTSGLCEEIARYLSFRFWAKDARSWRSAMVFGAGHGGIEAIIVGVITLIAFVQLVGLQSTDLTTLPITPEQLAQLQRQITDYWSAPWYATQLGAVERVFAMSNHLMLSVLVMQAFLRRNGWWLLAAIMWHAALNAMAVLIVGVYGIYWTEAVIGLFALVSLGAAWALRSTDEPRDSGPSAPLASPLAPPPAELTIHPLSPEDLQKKIDDSRFSG